GTGIPLRHRRRVKPSTRPSGVSNSEGKSVPGCNATAAGSPERSGVGDPVATHWGADDSLGRPVRGDGVGATWLCLTSDRATSVQLRTSRGARRKPWCIWHGVVEVPAKQDSTASIHRSHGTVRFWLPSGRAWRLATNRESDANG